MTDSLNCSVIIPTYNRAELLRCTLDSLVRQTLPVDRFEVLVDDGSSDGTADVVEEYQGILRIIQNEAEAFSPELVWGISDLTRAVRRVIRATALPCGLILVTTPKNKPKERPLRYHRTTGLALTQTQELVRRVSVALGRPWRKRTGRPKACGLYAAVEAACMYIRHNCTEEFLGDLRGVSQSTVSRILADLVPVVRSVLAEFVPEPKDAIRLVRGKMCLVDGTITPCWSYAEHRELWSRKHGTTGFCVQLVSLLDGTPVWISDPLPGSTHDKKAFDNTATVDIITKAKAGIGDKGYQGTSMYTPTKKPQWRKLTADEVTAELKGKGPMVRRYENGEVKPAWGTVLTMLGLYGAAAEQKSEAERLWDEVNEEPQSVRLPTGANRAYRKLVNAEREATRERVIAPYVLPSLLQIEPYVRALMAAGHRLQEPKTRPDSLTKARRTRQERLSDHLDPLRLDAVIDESVLHRKVGGAAVLREQLAHLLVVAELPNIDLRVVPFQVGAYGTMNGSCVIIDYPEPDATSGIYLEYPAGGAWVDNRDDVQRFTSMFDDVVQLALEPADTTNLIHEQIRALKEP